MKYYYLLMAIVLAIISWFTGEIVTFVMLGFILLALNNIQNVLQDISKKLNKGDQIPNRERE